MPVRMRLFSQSSHSSSSESEEEEEEPEKEGSQGEKIRCISNIHLMITWGHFALVK